jgi:hypothetical protein
MGLFKGLKRVADLADKGLDLADQAITDKDLLNKLHYDLIKKRAEFLLSGSGASITKITICALVSLLVAVGCIVFFRMPADMVRYKDFILSVTPLIGILIGVYGGAKTVQKIRK